MAVAIAVNCSVELRPDQAISNNNSLKKLSLFFKKTEFWRNNLPSQSAKTIESSDHIKGREIEYTGMINHDF
jgi:hypothetical protein